MIIEQLILEIQERGVAKADQDIRRLSSSVDGLFKSLGVLAAFNAVTSAVSNIQQMAETFATISGMRIAGEFQSIALSLEMVTGSGDKALKMMKEIKQIGKTTAFDTQDVARFATQMGGYGVKPDQIIPQLKRLLDAAAFAQVGRGDFDRVMFNILQIRSMENRKANFQDIKEMLRGAPGMGRVLAAGMGVAPDKVLSTLEGKGMTGGKVYEAFLKGADAIAKGAAAAQALRNPMAALANLMKTIRMIMEPTGALLITAFMPTLRLLQSIADFLQMINEKTYGTLGLAALIGAFVMLNAAIKIATAGVSVLASRLGMLGMGSAMVPAGAAGAGAAVAGGGLLGMISKFALRALGIIGIAGFASEMIRGDGKNTGRNKAADMTFGAGVGGALGLGAAMLAGLPALPFIIAGLVTGAVFTGIMGYLGDKYQWNKAPSDPALAEQKKQTKLLENIESKILTGSARSRGAISDAEIELAVAKAFSLGVA